MHPNQLAVGQVNSSYFDTVWITPSNAFFYHQWSMTPAIVAGGITLVPNSNNTINDATLQGTPTLTGSFNVTITGGGTYVLGTICYASRTYQLVITP
jgi:hypothetical protein